MESYIRYRSSSCCQVGLAVSSSLLLASLEASFFDSRMYVGKYIEGSVEVLVAG